MDDFQDIAGLEDLLDNDGQLRQPRRGGRQRHAERSAPADDEPIAPTKSWWTTPRSREEFRQQASAEQERIQKSKFGRQSGRVTEVA